MNDKVTVIKSIFKRIILIMLWLFLGCLLGFIFYSAWFVIGLVLDINLWSFWLTGSGIMYGTLLFAVTYSQLEFNYSLKETTLLKDFFIAVLEGFFVLFVKVKYLILGYLIGLAGGISLLIIRDMVNEWILGYDHISKVSDTNIRLIIAGSVFLGLILLQIKRLKGTFHHKA